MKNEPGLSKVGAIPDDNSVDTPGFRSMVYRRINQHYDGSLDVVKVAQAMPEDMFMVFEKTLMLLVNKNLLKTNGRELWELSPKELVAHVLLAKIDDLRDWIAECPEKNNRVISNAVSVGIDIMSLAMEHPNGELAQLVDDVRKLPKAVAENVVRAWKQRPRKEVGKPPRYTKKKMGQAFDRMHKLIINSGMKQLPAAKEVIKKMKLDIGERYLTERYRAWLPTRQQRKTT